MQRKYLLIGKMPFDKIRFGDNQGGRSREPKIVRVRTVFKRFFFK